MRIDQFSFVTSSAPETGRNPGGTANLVIKSGTNQFHGTLYYFNRNEALAANTPFADGSPKNKDRFLIYGGLGRRTYLQRQDLLLCNLRAQQLRDRQSKPLDRTLGRLPGRFCRCAGVLRSSGQSAVQQHCSPTFGRQTRLPVRRNANNYYNTSPLTGHSFNGIVKFDQNFTEKDHLSVKAFMGQGNQVAPTFPFSRPTTKKRPFTYITTRLCTTGLSRLPL